MAERDIARGLPMALGLLWALNIGIAAVTAALLVVLVVIYGKNARAIRSRFAVGLLLFAVLFLAQSFLGMWAYMAMNDAGQGPEVAFPMLLLNTTGMAAIATLVIITWD